MKMNDTELTKKEEDFLRQYQGLSTSIPSLTRRLAIEIIPPIVFVAVWFYTKSTIYLVVLILILVTYNVQRILRQYKNIVKLNSISMKIIGEATDETKT